MPAVLPLAVIIVSGIVYHLAQKTSSAARPWPMLAVAYGAAFALSLGLTVAGRGRGAALPSLPLPTVAGALLLGLAAFGIEAGFFFIYRAGGALATAQVIANVVVTSALALVGIFVFGEDMTVARAAGLALAAAGATLIVRGAP